MKTSSSAIQTRSVIFSVLCLGAFFTHATARATADYEDEISIVSENFNDGSFSVKKLPFIGCAGIPVYCNVSMFTFDYKIPSGGCGQEFKQDTSINTLACAKFEPTIEEVEKSDPTTGRYIIEEVTKATIDLSGCEEKFSSSIYASYLEPQEQKQREAELKKVITTAFDRNFATAKSLTITYKGKTL